MLQPKVFKAYDVRGVYGVEWDAAGAALITRAFIEKFEIKKLVLGWDMRISSPEMVVAVSDAAVAAGVDVVMIGEVTTPMLYFGTAGYLGNDAGIMITASHNTGEWNGMKILLGDGTPIGESSGLVDIKERALAGGFVDTAVAGSVESREIESDYFDRVLRMAPLASDKKISAVIDCGNGMEGSVIRKFLDRLPMVAAEVMYETPDGSFPNHEANPLKTETLNDLREQVLARSADIGIAFDGDGDRVGFVDETGAVIGGDVLTGIVARELLAENQGAAMLYDLRSRKAVAREIEKAGGVPLMSRVGHAFIKKQMRETGALFAGELSCHFYFKDFYNVECADGMVLAVLAAMQKHNKKLSELAADFLHDAHSGEINFEVHDRESALEKIKGAYESLAKRVITIDGLLFEFEDWWFSVRPSNTEPVLRLNLEAYNEEKMQEKLAEVKSLIQ